MYLCIGPGLSAVGGGVDVADRKRRLKDRGRAPGDAGLPPLASPERHAGQFVGGGVLHECDVGVLNPYGSVHVESVPICGGCIRVDAQGGPTPHAAVAGDHGLGRNDIAARRNVGIGAQPAVGPPEDPDHAHGPRSVQDVTPAADDQPAYPVSPRGGVGASVDPLCHGAGRGVVGDPGHCVPRGVHIVGRFVGAVQERPGRRIVDDCRFVKDGVLARDGRGRSPHPGGGVVGDAEPRPEIDVAGESDPHVEIAAPHVGHAEIHLAHVPGRYGRDATPGLVVDAHDRRRSVGINRQPLMGDILRQHIQVLRTESI